MREVNVGHKSLADYRASSRATWYAEIDELADGPRGQEASCT